MEAMSVDDSLAVLTGRRTVMMWFAAFLLANLTATIVVLVTYGAGDNDSLTPIWVIGASGLAMWGSYLFVLSQVSRKYGSGDFARDYRIRFAPRDAWGIPLGIASQFVLVTIVTYPLTKLFPDSFSVEEVEKRARDLADSAPGAWMILLFAIVVLGAPVIEEIVYRGMLQQGLERSIDQRGALVLTAVIFAAIHMQPIEFPGLFAFALVLGWTYQRTKRLGLAIVTHMAFNASGLVAVTLL
jgi:membrane protease YdiL (CAAX protease family)